MHYPLLSDEEILRRLRIIRHSDRTERNARRAPSINGLALHAGISSVSIYRTICSNTVGATARPLLSEALQTYYGEGWKRSQARPDRLPPSADDRR